jgi:hypothetical protein
MTVLAGSRTDAHLALFSTEAFHRLNLGPDERYLRIDHVVAGRLVASLCGRVDGVRFVCGASAPFGGIDVPVEHDARVDALTELVGLALDRLRDEGVTRAEIRLRPAAHGPVTAAAEAALLGHGFTLGGCAVNQHLDLSAYADAGAHLASLPKKRRWALRQDLAAGYRFQDADAVGGWAQVHAVVDRARTVKNRPAWLPQAYLQALREAFPGRVSGHLLELDGVAVAAAVVYRVSPAVDLLAAWGDTGTARRSPMNLLAHRLVERSLAHGARVLDLGISSEHDGTPNPGLIHFKRSVGAQDGIRTTLVKDLT